MMTLVDNKWDANQLLVEMELLIETEEENFLRVKRDHERLLAYYRSQIERAREALGVESRRTAVMLGHLCYPKARR
jgi:hypothetical protein